MCMDRYRNEGLGLYRMSMDVNIDVSMNLNGYRWGWV